MPLIDDIGLEEAKAILHKIADIFHIGVEARQTDTILANATNAAASARRKLPKSDPVELQIGREARAAYRRFSEFRQFTSNFSVVFKTEDDCTVRFAFRDPKLSAKDRTDVCKLPSVEQRVETGPIAFGNDWPGVFIRGDNAMWYALQLRMVQTPDRLAAIQIEQLRTLLESCQVQPAQKGNS